jgi:hypothetical protein
MSAIKMQLAVCRVLQYTGIIHVGLTTTNGEIQDPHTFQTVHTTLCKQWLAVNNSNGQEEIQPSGFIPCNEMDINNRECRKIDMA